ncbi:toprim domain-containing protein [Methylomonas sp. LL1]|uniref:toprim domain-containing protein n=1 Tax=Methylomonas sp. LL1 TaxID=2785785 RepID=UPI0018C3809B|nr:toprim domain-containing protein [Methylomonas sp. LL1]QPK65160.1 toprim domain-containing protein [Methylomonas sp. LL1]
MNINDLIDAVRADMAAHGVETDDKLIADGVLHRAHAEGDKVGTLNISYLIHADGNPSWYFEYFPRSIKKTGSLAGERRTLTPSERRQIETERKKRQRERHQRQKAAAEKARAIWHKANPIPSTRHHGYLIKKGVKPFQVRHYNEALVILLYNESREPVNLQFIDAAGNKRFLAGGKKKGCFSVIGSATGADKVVICEGWATGASLHEELGVFVMVAMDAGNLEPVALVTRRLFPDAEIIIAGDNDESGTGQAAARKAALAVGGKYLIPEQAGADWNDVIAAGGAV